MTLRTCWMLALSLPTTALAQDPAGSPGQVQPAVAALAAAPAPPSDSEADAARIDRLVTVLTTDDSFKVRLQAAVLLGRTNNPRAGQPLIDALGSDPDYTVRAAAAVALANLKEPRAITHIVKRIAVDPEAFVREEATRALGKFDRASALPYVVASCNSTDPRVRKEALAYVATEPTAAVEPVLERALGDTPEIYDIAKQAAAKMPRPEVLRFLEAALDHREPSVRRGAIEVLQALKGPEAAQLVLEVYDRDVEEEEVKNAARTALRELRGELPVTQIVKDATSSPEKHARARALRLMGVVGGPEAQKVLVGALADDDYYVRGIAVMALGELGNPAAVPSLEKLIEDPANQRIVHLVRTTLTQLRSHQEARER